MKSGRKCGCRSSPVRYAVLMIVEKEKREKNRIAVKGKKKGENEQQEKRNKISADAKGQKKKERKGSVTVDPRLDAKQFSEM